MGDPIKKIELKDGTTRYRFVIDIGRDLASGRRKQLTKTYDTRKEARAEYAKIKHQTDEGTVAAGSMHIRHNDGSEMDIGPGDAYVIEPGHDAWVTGSEVFVGFEFDSKAAEAFATS